MKANALMLVLLKTKLAPTCPAYSDAAFVDPAHIVMPEIGILIKEEVNGKTWYRLRPGHERISRTGH